MFNRGNYRRDLFALAGAPEKLQLAAQLKATTSVSNGWLTARLAMGAPGSVTQFVRRWHAGEGRGRAAVSGGFVKSSHMTPFSAPELNGDPGCLPLRELKPKRR